ncbi:hypothetical protein K502DRAFT_343946 [Neoconidiobolus thromboides FSU 785]|nr:hypothetical protein K502DRAFT_343946 [Neoconidiobolus thromboides FSU 785]
MSSSASENSVSNEPSKQWESDDDSNKNRNCDHFDQYDIEKDEKQGNEENIDGIENTASDCKRYVVKNKTNALEFLDNQEITSVFKNEKVEFDLVNSLYNAENEHSLRLEELIHPCFDRNAYNRLHEVYKHNALDDFKQDNMTNAMSEGIKHEIKMSNNIIKQATNSKESEILATRRNSNISEFELINLSNSNENNSDSLNFTNTGELVLDQEPESDNSSKSENEVLIQGIESNSKELIEEAKNEFEDYKMQLIIEAALSELKKDNEVDKKLTEQEIIRGIEEGLFDREAGYSGFSEVQDERDSEEYISGQDDVNFIGKGPTEKNDGCSRFFKTQDRDDDKSDNESDIECDNYFNNIINNYNKNKTKFNKINERMKRLNNRTLKYENKMVKIGYNKTDYET